MALSDVSRSRMEFEFEFIREAEGTCLAKGQQAVVWTNQQHRPALMPDKLYDSIVGYFGVSEADL